MCPVRRSTVSVRRILLPTLMNSYSLGGKKKTDCKLKLKKLFFIFKCCLATWLIENNITLISLPEKSIARHTHGSENTEKL